MLVLSRKLKEAIIIGDGDEKIIIYVVKIERDKVKLAIDAPVEVPVHRKEVFDSIKASNHQAAIGSTRGALPKAVLNAARKMNKRE